MIISYLPVHKKDDGSPGSEKEDSGADQLKSQTNEEGQDQNQPQQKEPTSIPEYDSDKLKDNPINKHASEHKYVSIREHWGFGFSYHNNLPDKNKDQKAVCLTLNN